MNRIARIIWDILISRNAAVILLFTVTVLLAAGAVLPNPGLLGPEEADALRARYPLIYKLGERYNSQDLAKSWLFGFAGVFLIVSTTLCSIDRFSSRSRTGPGGRILSPARMPGGMQRDFENAAAAELADRAATWLRKNRWRVSFSPEGAETNLVGRRGQAGFWGSIFFHGILISALFGMVVYYFGGYRARLLFTEGQAYPLREERFYHVEKRPVWGFRLPDVEVGLLKQYAFYSPEAPWSPSDYVAKFLVREAATGRSWEKDVRINDPLVIDGKEFVLVVGGYSPRIVIRKRDGAVVFDKYVALKKSRGTEDSVLLDGEDLRIDATFYPDYAVKEGSPATKTLQLKNPFLHVALRRGARTIAGGLVPFGGSMEADGYLLMFPDVRRWVEMEMVGEPGIGFFFSVLFLGVAGLMVRIFDPDETFSVVLEQKGPRVRMTVMPSSRHFPGLINMKAEEFILDLEERFCKGGAAA